MHNVGRSRYKARAPVPRLRGRVPHRRRFGQTKTAATNALREALAEQQARGAEFTRQSPVNELVIGWLAEVEASDRAAQTKENYRTNRPVHQAWRRAAAAQRGDDVSLRALLQHPALDHGPAAAYSTRTALNGLIGLAIRHDASLINPVRETKSVNSPPKTPSSLSREEVDDLTDRLHSDERALYLDLPDLVDFDPTTGCSIDEVLAIRYGVNSEGQPLLDLESGLSR